jgi:hypothetical protein
MKSTGFFILKIMFTKPLHNSCLSMIYIILSPTLRHFLPPQLKSIFVVKNDVFSP